ERGWLLREPRRVESALRLLGRGAGVLLIRTGRDLDRELALLDQATDRFPEAAVVLITDGDHPRLPALGWDLGAACVLTADQAREQLVELVEALMRGVS